VDQHRHSYEFTNRIHVGPTVESGIVIIEGPVHPRSADDGRPSLAILSNVPYRYCDCGHIQMAGAGVSNWQDDPNCACAYCMWDRTGRKDLPTAWKRILGDDI
jgi:hypothetical protein